MSTRRTVLVSFLLAATITMLPLIANAEEEVSWQYETANPEQQKALDDLVINAFNEQCNDHELTIDYRGYYLDKQLRIALLSGTDIVYTPGPSFVATMARAGQLLPLDE